MVTQTVHLKTFSSRGQRTREPQVMQLPVAKSLLPPLVPPLLCVVLLLPGGFVMTGASSSESVLWEVSGRFFLLENSEGNGWLMERECVGRRGRLGWKSDSEELESAWRWELSKIT